MNGPHYNRHQDDTSERWNAFQRKRDSKYGVCPKCNVKKELLICVYEHAFVYCPCRDRICSVCGSFDGIREPLPYKPENRAPNSEAAKAEWEAVRLAEEALSSFKRVPFPGELEDEEV